MKQPNSVYITVLSIIAILINGLQADPDHAFGFTGSGSRQFAERFRLHYYAIEGNYTAASPNLCYSMDPQFDPPLGHSVVREAAKLDYRRDGLGESAENFQAKLRSLATKLSIWYLTPSFIRGSKPELQWYTSDGAALVASEGANIIATIRREKAATPPITGTVWEIGNEPNMFPCITPQEYADIFTRYYAVIKAEDPGASVAMGALFQYEVAPDLRARMELAMEEEIKASLGGDTATLKAAGLLDNLIDDLNSAVFERLYKYTTPAYLAAVLDALLPSQAPDILTLHTYPYYNAAPADFLASLSDSTVKAMDAIKAVLTAKNLSIPIWITEFGNVQPGLEKSHLAAQADTLVSVFQRYQVIEKWFYYKPVLSDQKLSIFNGGEEVLTRLSAGPGFYPANGAFSCDSLNQAGMTYYYRSHGYHCLDLPAGPLLNNSTTASAIEGQRFVFRLVATDPSLPMTTDFLRLPSWLQAAGDSAWGVPDDSNGDTVVTVTATVNERTDTLSVSLTVTPRNGAPAIDTLARQPDLLNPAGSPISDDSILVWGWKGPIDPDLDTTNLMAKVESYSDSSLHHRVAYRDSILAPTLKVADLGIPDSLHGREIWLVVSVKNASGYTTGAGNPVKFTYFTAATFVATGADLPKFFELKQNTPNPFSTHTQVALSVPRAASHAPNVPVSIVIYNVKGKRVQLLFRGSLAPGRHAFIYRPLDKTGNLLPPGIYLAAMRAPGYRQLVKMQLAR